MRSYPFFSHLKLMLLVASASWVLVEMKDCTGDANDDKCQEVARSTVERNDMIKKSSSSHGYKVHQCTVYLAPSSIPHAGFGMYTTRDIQRGEKVYDYGTDAPSIPVCDNYAHGMEETDWNHVDYFWSGSGLAEFECDQVSESVMTFGSLCNFHTYLVSLSPHTQPYDDTILDRFTDPSAGAISYHNGHAFTSSRKVSAGEELFCDYGEEWLDDRPETFADFVPKSEDFVKAVSSFDKIRREIRTNGVEMTDSLLKTIKNIVMTAEPRLAGALPDTVEKVKELDSRRGDKERPALVMAQIGLHERSMKWIEENGVCLDNIRPGKSTIPHVGRGAFVQGHISKGDIVAPSPLLNVVDIKKLRVTDIIDEETGKYRFKRGDEKNINVIGSQLLLNYCFGHRDSELVLCPQSGMILMNHCSTRKVGGGQCGDKGPNAKVQWATGWDPDTADWLKISLDDIRNKTSGGMRGLSLEVVATRDILPGEEVMIDYGENWERAWEAHVINWEAPIDDGTYVPVRKMVDSKDYRTIDELKTKPYAENVQLVCYYSSYLDDEEEDDDDDVKEIKRSGARYTTMNGMDAEHDVQPCEILERESNCKYAISKMLSSGCITTYTVRILEGEDSKVLLTDYPEDSITFRMRKYKSDMHLKNTFRHFIEIADDIFPDEWKNMKK